MAAIGWRPYNRKRRKGSTYEAIGIAEYIPILLSHRRLSVVCAALIHQLIRDHPQEIPL